MWLHRHEERVRLGCVKESLLDFIYHAHEVLREFKWRLVVCVCVWGVCTRIYPKSGYSSTQPGCVPRSREHSWS